MQAIFLTDLVRRLDKADRALRDCIWACDAGQLHGRDGTVDALTKLRLVRDEVAMVVAALGNDVKVDRRALAAPV